MSAKLAIGLIAACLALAPVISHAQDAPAAQAEATAMSLYEKGRTALRTGDYDGAMKALYASLEKLRAEGRGGSADAGLVAGFLASAMEKLEHAQTEEAWRLAFTLLERAANPNRFIEAASGLLRKMNTPERSGEADTIIERLINRINVEGVSDDARLEALSVAVSFYTRVGRKATGDALLTEQAVRLNGETQQALEMRGVARLRRANDAFRKGEQKTFDSEIEDAILDFRRALPASARDLGHALSLKAQMRMKEGVYTLALSDAEEAAAILEGANAEDRYLEARVIQIRVLERVERGREALERARALSAQYETRSRRDESHAAMLRLLIVEMLAADGQLAQARAALELERARLSENGDKIALALFYDRLAEVYLMENDFANAAKAAENSLATFRIARPTEQTVLLEPMRKRASASEGMRDRAYGDRAHRELIDLSSTLFHSSHPEFARDLDAYAGFLEAEGRRREAFEMRRRSVAALERAYGENGVKVAYALNNMASLLNLLGHYEEAADAIKRGLAIIGDAPELAARRVTLRANLANSLIELNRGEDAMREIERARSDAVTLERRRERHMEILDIVEMLALDELGRTGEAYRQAERIVANARTQERNDASNMLAVHVKMAQLAQKMGDDSKALEASARAIGLITSAGIATDGKWRATAETALPSLWRLSQK